MDAFEPQRKKRCLAKEVDNPLSTIQRKKRCLAKEVDNPLSTIQAKLFAELGREIRVFTNSAASATSCNQPVFCHEEADDFYDLSPEDYYRLTSHRMGAQPGILKSRKVREAEIAAREASQRARIPKAIIRVRFPDHYILEAKFQSSDKLQSLMDLLKKVISRSDLPFYIYTTPPKKLIRDMSKDFYSAGFAPGANVYFSYDLPIGSELNKTKCTGFYLRGDILSLSGLDYPIENVYPVLNMHEASCLENRAREQVYPVCYEHEVASMESDGPEQQAYPACDGHGASFMEIAAAAAAPEHEHVTKKPTKPKWFKL